MKSLKQVEQEMKIAQENLEEIRAQHRIIWFLDYLKNSKDDYLRIISGDPKTNYREVTLTISEMKLLIKEELLK